VNLDGRGTKFNSAAMMNDEDQQKYGRAEKRHRPSALLFALLSEACAAKLVHCRCIRCIGAATRSLTSLYVVGAGTKPASTQSRGMAVELSHSGYFGLYKWWFIGVDHGTCFGAMVCKETLRTKRESASCSAPLYGVFHVCSFGRHLARP